MIFFFLDLKKDFSPDKILTPSLYAGGEENPKGYCIIGRCVAPLGEMEWIQAPVIIEI